MTEIVFYLFAAIAIISSVFILFTRNILYAAFALVITLLCVAVFYIFANAEFLAVTQIMIYVGGIVVLMIFGVMLTSKASSTGSQPATTNVFMGAVVAVGMMIVLIYGVLRMNLSALKSTSGNRIEDIGQGLMTEFVFPFEIAAVLLLIALVAAAVIAGHNLKNNEDK